jgi:hypothetical protein
MFWSIGVRSLSPCCCRVYRIAVFPAVRLRGLQGNYVEDCRSGTLGLHRQHKVAKVQLDIVLARLTCEHYYELRIGGAKTHEPRKGGFD